MWPQVVVIKRLQYTLMLSDQEELLKSNQSHCCSKAININRSDALQVGDYIQAINGIATDRLTQREVHSLFRSAGAVINLEVSYEVPADYGNDIICYSHMIGHVILTIHCYCSVVCHATSLKF